MPTTSSFWLQSLEPVELDDDSDFAEQPAGSRRTICLNTQDFKKEVDTLKASRPELFEDDDKDDIAIGRFCVADLFKDPIVLDSDSDSDDSIAEKPARVNCMMEEEWAPLIAKLRSRKPELFHDDRPRSPSETAVFLTHPRRPPKKEHAEGPRTLASMEQPPPRRPLASIPKETALSTMPENMQSRASSKMKKSPEQFRRMVKSSRYRPGDQDKGDAAGSTDCLSPFLNRSYSPREQPLGDSVLVPEEAESDKE
jgi:hypothetical protein